MYLQQVKFLFLFPFVGGFLLLAIERKMSEMISIKVLMKPKSEKIYISDIVLVDLTGITKAESLVDQIYSEYQLLQ